MLSPLINVPLRRSHWRIGCRFDPTGSTTGCPVDIPLDADRFAVGGPERTCWSLGRHKADKPNPTLSVRQFAPAAPIFTVLLTVRRNGQSDPRDVPSRSAEFSWRNGCVDQATGLPGAENQAAKVNAEPPGAFIRQLCGTPLRTLKLLFPSHSAPKTGGVCEAGYNSVLSINQTGEPS